MACKEGQFDVVELMVNDQFKINLNAQHVNGMTPFDVQLLLIRYSRVYVLLSYVLSRIEVRCTAWEGKVPTSEVNDLLDELQRKIIDNSCKLGHSNLHQTGCLKVGRKSLIKRRKILFMEPFGLGLRDQSVLVL